MSKTTQDILDYLSGVDDVTESYVLVREINAFIDVGVPYFHPSIKVKIWKSNVIPDNPYHFDLSHHVHTPSQAAPYRPSRTVAPTEQVAIDLAFSAFRSFLVSAIAQGHEPSDEWLIENEDF